MKNLEQGVMKNRVMKKSNDMSWTNAVVKNLKVMSWKTGCHEKLNNVVVLRKVSWQIAFEGQKRAMNNAMNDGMSNVMNRFSVFCAGQTLVLKLMSWNTCCHEQIKNVLSTL